MLRQYNFDGCRFRLPLRKGVGGYRLQTASRLFTKSPYPLFKGERFTRHCRVDEAPAGVPKCTPKLPVLRKLRRTIGLAFFCCLTVAACAGEVLENREILYPAASTLLPGTRAEMNSAGYWIGRLPDPDRVIMDSRDIDAFNRRIREQGLVRDLADFEPPTGKALHRELSSTAEWLGHRRFYRSNGHQVGSDFLDPLVDLMNAESIPKRPVALRGFVTAGADLRVLPTVDPLWDAPGDRFIDHLQASRLEAGTPLAIAHRSRDGQWAYVFTELAAGWLPSDVVVETGEEAFLERYRSAATAVVIAPTTDLWADPDLTRFRGTVRMGTRLVLADPDTESSGATATADAPRASRVAVTLPVRGPEGAYRETTLWLDGAEVAAGYLPYTQRTVIRQAFRQLSSPYGWGGMFGERDCSQFVVEVFSTVGVKLPRTSRSQARVGHPLSDLAAETADADKIGILLADAVPGITLLCMRGHVMLYLGETDRRPFAIHAAWSYREQRNARETVRLINRVAVTTLDLGAGSKKGSYLSRLSTGVLVASVNIRGLNPPLDI